jgi:hypothetical protein
MANKFVKGHKQESSVVSSMGQVQMQQYKFNPKRESDTLQSVAMDLSVTMQVDKPLTRISEMKEHSFDGDVSFTSGAAMYTQMATLPKEPK